ncbi:uncharacterized protein LOC121053447 [Oryza brachyantha]|uniref:uncharacterized protein LOC121053447 n=1 Tax=Oryza brachyantha TaxID=4533 RepID=UPI001ADBB47F|nr:uncharacterized protein LOC121053447 [Oryza brachyantha]
MASSCSSAMAGLAEREVEEEERRRLVPEWLRPLLAARFFTACPEHRRVSKSECNHYCLTCAGAGAGAAAVGCHWCVEEAHGAGHQVVQVRRSSYHSVVRVSELERALDLSRVQTYVINRDRVVFLNERAQAPRNGRCAAASAAACSACEACGRGLLDAAFRFCSLGCKLRCMESDPTLTFTIDPNNMPEQQISGPPEDEDEDDDDAAAGKEEDEPFYPSTKNSNKNVQSKLSCRQGRQPPAPAPPRRRPATGGGGERQVADDNGGRHNGGKEAGEAAATILAFAAATERPTAAAAPTADPNSYRRRARKGVHRVPERAPFF